MKFAATYEIPAPRDRVFAAISDPEILRQCIEGCEQMVQTAGDSYEAQLKLGMAGLKGKYSGKVQLKDKRPPESYTLVIEGKGAPGFVKGTARIQLAEKGPHTELRCDADAQVGGLIAAIGSRLIEAGAKKMMDDFFRRFADKVKPA